MEREGKGERVREEGKRERVREFKVLSQYGGVGIFEPIM